MDESLSIWLRDVFMPYEFATVSGAISFIKQLSMGITHGIILLEKDTEHLTLRCPVSGEYLDITSSVDVLNKLDRELRRNHLYKTD